MERKKDVGETALHVSARKGDCRQCKKLLQEGALVNTANSTGSTALHEACLHSHFKVAKILISNGADIDAVSNNGNTPLHIAVTRGCEKLVWLLLHSGADREKLNNDGKKPIDLCPQQLVSVRTLLTDPSVPDKCSSSDVSDMSSNNESHVEARSSLAVTVAPSNVFPVKQSTPSLAETETAVHSETYSQNEAPDYHQNIDLHEEREQHESLDDDIDHSLLVHEREKDYSQGDGVVGEADFQNSAQEVQQVSVEVCTPQRGALWNNDEVTSAKNDEALEAEAEDGDQDTAMQHDEELASGETRKWVRTRATPRKVAVCQDKAPFTDKRKQRGRRRGKVATSSRPVPLPQASTSEDVYEFRESPEPDHDNNQLEVLDEGGLSPETKRQRIEGTFVHTQTVQSCSKREEKRQVEVGDVFKPNLCSVEVMEEVNGGRKVPPLRISLPRTPSEDNAVTINPDEVAPVAAGTRNGTKRNARIGKNQGKKELTPEDPAAPPPADNGMHRMTRSRVRQAGRTIKDDVASASYFDTGIKRRGQNSTRRSGIPSGPEVASPVASGEKEENLDNNGESSLFGVNGNGSEDNRPVGPVDVLNAFVMSLMKKNTYEGYRELRMKIEDSWIDTMSLPAPNPVELPANYEDYMIFRKGFTLKSNIDSTNLTPETRSDLTPELNELRKAQEEKRQRMTIKHKIEKERLQMLAEREVLRMLNRKANPERETMSTVRVQHESDIFNAWYLKERCTNHPIVEYDKVKNKFFNEVYLMENRQKMESDALFAEQVYTWNGMLRNLGLLSVPGLKDNVPKVPVPHLELKL